MRPLPRDTSSLLDELHELYPPRVRKPDESEREHERYAGKVDLIAELFARRKRS
jgi:hypothetical protein